VVDITETAIGIAETMQKRVEEGVLSREDAFKRMQAAIVEMRYGKGRSDYMFAQDLRGFGVIHPAKRFIGTDMNGLQGKGKDKKYFIREMVDLARTKGEGFVEYYWSKKDDNGNEKIVKKISYLKVVPFWDMYLGTGIYVDDVEEEYMDAVYELAKIASIFIIIAVALVMIISRNVVGSLNVIRGKMKLLADGNLDVDIHEVSRQDEIGEMAKTVQVFKDNALEKVRLEAEQAENKRKLAEERKRAMLELADNFESSIKGVVETVSSSATEMQASAEGLANMSQNVSSQTTAVSASSEEMSTNISTVAAAAEQLSAATGEIGDQVSKASTITSEAVNEAKRADELVQGLSEAANKIGDVVELIKDVADQTNLLALNATIEAARAGDAGKGFAVVASEVKNLANQTARATDEIAAQIAEVQNSTSTSVEAIQAIGNTIESISEVSSNIASAIEEQSASTQEISRNVGQAASATQQVSGSITSVNGEAQNAGAASEQLVEATNMLSKESEKLQTDVNEFIAYIRKTAEEEAA
jgi:methyl-accepting chemotaxis protein